MKPYALGCCAGHDWLVLWRFTQSNSRGAARNNRLAKRARRRIEAIDPHWMSPQEMNDLLVKLFDEPAVL